MINYNNLVAIAYKTGFCGSLIYYLVAHSPTVAKYQPLAHPSFNDGTAHEGTEFWFNNLHDYYNSLTVSEELWESYLTDESKKALSDKDKLVVFRCHPNTAYKLNFVQNLKVLFVTHSDPLVCERWAYEKVYKPAGEQFFFEAFEKFFKTKNSPKKINNILKRRFLINNIHHDLVSLEKCMDLYGKNLFNIKLEKILNKDYHHYCDICKFLNIIPMLKNSFDLIIYNYCSKQWKRF